jgi:hypothetical protein
MEQTAMNAFAPLKLINAALSPPAQARQMIRRRRPDDRPGLDDLPVGGYPAHACVEDRHRSREFVSFLKQLDAAYPVDTAIKLILDNHSAHTLKENQAWLATKA